MAKPIFETNWYFCGEHTNSIHRGTVHGAYESGFNAASDILIGVDFSNWEYLSSAVWSNIYYEMVKKDLEIWNIRHLIFWRRLVFLQVK